MAGARAAPVKFNPWTYNVVLGVLTSVFYSLGYGLFQSTVLPSFILQVGGSNFAIGFSEGLQGITNMVTAFPAGWLADRYSRSSCIRLGGVLWVLSGVCMILAVINSDSPHAFVLLCMALALEGVCDGIISGPLVALMDDSVPAGYRSDVETFNTVATTAANAVGPALGMVVFLFTGNEWTLQSMQVVIVAGTLIGQLSNLFGVLMDDSKALGEESEAVHLQTNLLDTSDPKQAEEDPQKEEEDLTKGGSATCFGLVTPASVVYVMFVHNLIMSLGAGMTIKFFPVFFQQEGHLSPGLVNATFASLSGFTVVATLMAQKAAKRYGRLEVIIPCTTLAVIATFMMGIARPFYTNAYIMIPLFVVRCTLMWSCSALKGSVVADYTPKSTRGRWKALSSITAMGWSGSAAVGGWLIDKYGYGDCFVITSLFQALAIPMLVVLLPHVAKETELTKALENKIAPLPSPVKPESILSTPNTRVLRSRSHSGVHLDD
eukprot:TRINITY_DN38990_c0_g1_i1.p1 TRINITY_DN38990_c0_g1~~TRINITY_DN38990_c0_g1_i1.p1  ORF type:complete len:490 (+),score=100.30 TRINITY_DN38990_c0_g1_i1:91-1560(+)